MTSAQVAAQLTDDGVLYSLIASVTFLAAVAIFDPRLRKTAVGKSLIMVDAGLSALYVPSVLHRFFGLQVTQAWFAWYFLATILVVGTGVWWRTVLMIREQLRARRPAKGIRHDGQ